jgi:hypothetical protein
MQVAAGNERNGPRKRTGVGDAPLVFCAWLGCGCFESLLYGVVHSWKERACDAVLGVLSYLTMADGVLYSRYMFMTVSAMLIMR